MLSCMANLLQHMVGDGVVVRHAHMELAEPSIATGFADCVAAGAADVTVFPYMLSPGKHVTRDIPRLVDEAARSHPEVACRVTPAFGVHAKLAELIAQRAGIEILSPVDANACTCWEPHAATDACGSACAARSAEHLTPAPSSSTNNVSSRR